ncbi:MAG TPA: helix-turn-helix transcriptional regulator [Chitinophagaceae bacterium]|jgi:AraC-like DNA-binding protein|nr:helix-turn-helix transcriptional regulator [Chitinophagaceae bacterium]
MAKASIPVYDIGSIDRQAGSDLLIERLGPYLEKHPHLHRPHRHTFYHLVLFTKGEGSHTIDFNRFPVAPYQMYFMVPGQVHSWHFECTVDGYIVHFSGALFSSFLQDGRYLERFPFFGGNSGESVCLLPPPVRPAVSALLDAALEERRSGGGQSLDLIRLKLLELFLTVERCCASGKSSTVPQQKQMVLRNFQRLIEAHFHTLRLPREYAELLYVTPNYLNALCRDLLGKTAGDLIRERVLLEAKRLLTHADLTVAAIAYDLQFRDNSYFNRFFKKYVGLTPDDFRKTFFPS